MSRSVYQSKTRAQRHLYRSNNSIKKLYGPQILKNIYLTIIMYFSMSATFIHSHKNEKPLLKAGHTSKQHKALSRFGIVKRLVFLVSSLA